MSKENSNIGYKITIILLLILIAGLVYDKINSGQKNNELIAEIEETSFQKDSLNKELSDLYLIYNDLHTDNKSLNDSLIRQKQQIKELMEEISNVKSSDYAKIKQLKKEVETLKNIMKSYVKQIDELYQENQNLIAENTQIKDNYNKEVTKNEELIEEKDSLQEKVSVAKELAAYNINFGAINKRGKTTDRIKKAQKFQVCFMISENKVATVGQKNVYTRITKPGSGEVLRNDNSGFFNHKGQSISYSSVRQIEYDGKAQNICVYFNINSDNLPKGDYNVFIFVDGVQIGDKKVTLK